MSIVKYRESYYVSVLDMYDFVLWSWEFEFLTGNACDGSVAIPYTLIKQAPFLDFKRGWTGVNKVLACILKPA